MATTTPSGVPTAGADLLDRRIEVVDLTREIYEGDTLVSLALSTAALTAIDRDAPPEQLDELLAALARMDAVLRAVRRAAGQGSTPELERALLAQLRCLHALTGSAAADVVEDVVDAARRVLDAAEPAAPMLVLEMAQRTLASMIRRQAAATQSLPSAA